MFPLSVGCFYASASISATLSTTGIGPTVTGSMSRRGSNRLRNQAASAFRPTCATQSSASSRSALARHPGEKALKNIDRPVHIYTRSRRRGRGARRALAGRGFAPISPAFAPALGLVVLLAALAGFGAWRFWPRETPASDGLPTVAVLPSMAAEIRSRAISGGTSRARSRPYLSTFPGAHTLAVADSAAVRQAQSHIRARWRPDEGRRKDARVAVRPNRRRHGRKPVVR